MQTIILQDLQLLTNIQNTKYTTDYLGCSYCYSMININNLSSIIIIIILESFASYYFRNYYHIMCACLTAIRQNRCNATFYLHIMHMLVLTESILCSKICSLWYAFWHLPNFLPIMLIFVLSRYALYWQFTFIIVHFYIKMIVIGTKCKLQEQLQYKSCIKMYQFQKWCKCIKSSIRSNFNSYLTVMSPRSI